VHIQQLYKVFSCFIYKKWRIFEIVDNSVTYKIVALTLAGLVFLSTSMQSMSLHFCGGKFAGVGLFDQEASFNNCCTPKVSECQMASAPADDNCCTDEFIDLDWDTDIAIQATSIVDSDIDDTLVFSAFSYAIVNSPQSTTSPKSYIPPLLFEQRTVLFQQFLL